MTDTTTAPALNWLAEFPDYPEDGMPPIPADWQDISWGNDTCPSFSVTAGDRDIMVWVDYPTDDLREFPGGQRFGVAWGWLGFGNEERMLDTNDWDEVLAKVAELKTKATREFHAKPLLIDRDTLANLTGAANAWAEDLESCLEDGTYEERGALDDVQKALAVAGALLAQKEG